MDKSTTKKTVKELIRCDFCDEYYDEKTPEYAAKDRSGHNMCVCLKCQAGTLVAIYEPHVVRTPENVDIVPLAGVSQHIMEAWYWSYKEFTNDEGDRFDADLQLIPEVTGATVEELQTSVDAYLAALTAFWDKNHAALCLTERDQEFRKYPIKFALKLEVL